MKSEKLIFKVTHRLNSAPEAFFVSFLPNLKFNPSYVFFFQDFSDFSKPHHKVDHLLKQDKTAIFAFVYKIFSQNPKSVEKRESS